MAEKTGMTKQMLIRFSLQRSAGADRNKNYMHVRERGNNYDGLCRLCHAFYYNGAFNT